MTISADVSQIANSQPYSVSANVGANGVDVSSSTVTGGTQDTSSTSSSSSTSNSNLGESDFLQLLVTELQNQDPLNPMDNTQFISELAQFQTLSGMTSLQQSFATLSKAVQSSADAQSANASSIAGTSAVSLIGKSVRAELSNLDWDGSSDLSIPVYLGDAESATVQISDADGNVVRTLKTGDKDSKNVARVAWDGTDDKGKTVLAGEYAVSVPGSSDQYAFTDGTVSSVSNRSGKTLVQVNGLDFSLADLVSISAPDK